MTRSRLIPLGALAALFLAAPVGALVYDAAGADRIAPGTTVGRIDVGGRSAEEARAVLERRLGPRVRLPLTLVHGGRRFVVTPADLQARVDADGLVARALRAGRKGNPLLRALRDLVNHDAGIHLPLRVTYSEPALAAVVRRVGRAVDHPARAADVGFGRRGLRLEPGREGIAVRQDRLERAIVAALAGPGSSRRLAVPVRITRRPRRTLADLRRRYRLLIVISRPRKELRLYRRLHLVKIYEIAVGRAGFDTKPGRYQVVSKLKNPAWVAPRKRWAGRFAGKLVPPGSPHNPIKARWIGYRKGQGIHGTDDLASLGEAASHGCIRVSIRAVKELYRRVRIHTPVIIE